MKNKKFLFQAGLLLLLFSALILGENTAAGLVVDNYPDLPPLLYFGNALLLFLAAQILKPFMERYTRPKLMVGFLSIHFLILLMGAAFALATPLAFPFLYCYAYISKILLLLIFWTMANDLYDAQEAKMTFPLLMAIGTLGGFFAAVSIKPLIAIISQKSILIFAWAFLTIAAIPLVLLIFSEFKKAFLIPTDKPEKKMSFFTVRQDFNIIKKEPLLRSMTIYYFLN